MDAMMTNLSSMMTIIDKKARAFDKKMCAFLKKMRGLNAMTRSSFIDFGVILAMCCKTSELKGFLKLFFCCFLI